jgi:hypothetical protein
MFDWFFRPSCPVEPDSKAWIEERMTWLTEEFGVARLRGVKVVLPTPDFFPDAYHGTEDDVAALLKRVCGYMRIERKQPLTDLLTVFLGMGIFTANATIRDRTWTYGQMTGWSIGRQGYMSQRMYGYALALFALARGEEKPAWAGHLRLDVRSAFNKGLRYVRETGDTQFAHAKGRD